MIDWSVSSEGREWASTSSYILIVAVLDAVVTLQKRSMLSALQLRGGFAAAHQNAAQTEDLKINRSR